MNFQDDSDRLFDSLTDLTQQQIDVIKYRYRFLMAEYRRRSRMYSILFYSLRMTMTVGSLAVPALLSIQTNPSNQANMYWFTWALSLAVTTANGVMTLFKLDRRFFMLHATMEKLRTEMWQYVELSGRYSGHHGTHRPTHSNQYVFFCSHLEKIRMKHIEEEYIKMAENHDPPPQPLPPSTAQGPSAAAASAPGVPSPPDPSLLQSPSPGMSPSPAISTTTSTATASALASEHAPRLLSRTQTRSQSRSKSLLRIHSKTNSRRNSITTTGSDDTIIDLGISTTIKKKEIPFAIQAQPPERQAPERQAQVPEATTNVSLPQQTGQSLHL